MPMPPGVTEKFDDDEDEGNHDDDHEEEEEEVDFVANELKDFCKAVR